MQFWQDYINTFLKCNFNFRVSPSIPSGNVSFDSSLLGIMFNVFTPSSDKSWTVPPPPSYNDSSKREHHIKWPSKKYDNFVQDRRNIACLLHTCTHPIDMTMSKVLVRNNLLFMRTVTLQCTCTKLFHKSDLKAF